MSPRPVSISTPSASSCTPVSASLLLRRAEGGGIVSGGSIARSGETGAVAVARGAVGKSEVDDGEANTGE